ncbi:MAG TPA: TVP38/TMEM64 family protein [Flavobacterium sp.]|jgi:uncharacterized membrane protein YdjX (TVP38/TMEM64 family)
MADTNTTDTNTTEVRVKKSKKPLYISLSIIAMLILAYFFVPSFRYELDNAWAILTSGDEQQIKQWVSGFGWFGPVLIIIAMVAQMFLIVIPSWLLIIVAILAYGPVWGSVIVFVAVFAASSVGYAIGNYFGQPILQKLVGQKSQQKVADFIEEYGVWAIIITRVNPLLSSDAISIMAGVARMGYWRFIGGTLLGISPLIILIAVLGQFSSGLKTGLLWVSLFSLLTFVIYIWWDKRRKKKHD